MDQHRSPSIFVPPKRVAVGGPWPGQAQPPVEVSLQDLEHQLAWGQVTSPNLLSVLDCSENSGRFQELRHVTMFISQMEFPCGGWAGLPAQLKTQCPSLPAVLSPDDGQRAKQYNIKNCKNPVKYALLFPIHR